ncbi:hypothetical protein acdb102_19350 [Acidothermaceae bacterium B102]|nr:hypothetical protein acdb102_19350 [Acidothermaceae bacterium B102]
MRSPGGSVAVRPSTVTSRPLLLTTSPPRPGRWGVAARRGLSLWAITTSVYLALAALAQAIGIERRHYPTASAASWPFQVYARFDAGHFLGIARHGYYGPHTTTAAPAFFPGYPLAGRTLARMLSLGHPSLSSYLIAMGLLSWVGTAVAAVLLWRVAADQAGETVATASVAVLLAGPYSVFLISSYSEGPYLALALGAWIAARDDRWLLASACAALAAFTRVSGLFLGCALIVLYLHSRWVQRRARRAAELAALSAPFLAVGAYFAWLHAHTGSWSTWFDVQRRGWGRHTVSPVKAFMSSVHRIDGFRYFHNPKLIAALRFQSAMEVLFAVGLVAAVVLLASRSRWAEATYLGLTVASLLTSTFYLSVPRNMLTCFPIAILVGQWLTRHRHRAWRFVVVAASFAVVLINAASMLSEYWAG